MPRKKDKPEPSPEQKLLEAQEASYSTSSDLPGELPDVLKGDR